MKRKILLRISIFLLLFLSSGFSVLNDIISSTVTIALWFFLLLLCVLLPDKSRMGGGKILIPMGLITLTFCLTSFLVEDPLFEIIANVFTFVVAFAFVSSIDFSSFKESFGDVLKILCVISLIGFFSISFIPFFKQLLSPFLTQNASGSFYYNFFIYAHPDSFNRNQGMFWEPGAFQVFINIALFFELRKPLPKLFNILLYITSVITTFSTTGYIAMVIIFIVAFSNKSVALKRTRKVVFRIVPVLIILVVFYSSALTSTSDYSTFGKLHGFREEQAWDRDNVDKATSTTVRWYSIVMAIDAFFEKPLTGWGSSGLAERNFEYTLGMNTCTFLNWFAKYGIIYGIVMLIGFIDLCYILGYDIGKKGRFLLFLFFFIVTISEEFSRNAFFLVLCFYGYQYRRVFENRNFLSTQNEIYSKDNIMISE